MPEELVSEAEALEILDRNPDLLRSWEAAREEGIPLELWRKRVRETLLEKMTAREVAYELSETAKEERRTLRHTYVKKVQEACLSYKREIQNILQKTSEKIIFPAAFVGILNGFWHESILMGYLGTVEAGGICLGLIQLRVLHLQREWKERVHQLITEASDQGFVLSEEERQGK